MRFRKQILAGAVTTALVTGVLAALVTGPVGAVTPCPTITVSSTADSGAGTLREAITSANSGCGSNSDVTVVIPVSLGTITLTSGEILVTGGVGNAHTLTIQGNYNTVEGNNSFRLIHGSGSFAGLLAIDALTLKKGTASGNGGAVYMEGTSSTVAIVGSTFRDNVSGGSGGAVHSWGDISVTGSSFTDNSATAGQGGAVWGNGRISLVDTTFTGNAAPNDAGGAVTAQNNTLVPIIVRTVFTNNTAKTNGGAIYSTASSAAVNVVSSSFSGNFAENYGGAVYVGYSAVVSDSSFTGNSTSASGYGGAIMAFGTVDTLAVEVTNSTFANNTASDQGGAIAAWLGEVNVTNSTFSGNGVTTANGHGGAVYAFSKVTVTYGSFAGNTSLGAGSAIWSSQRTAHLFGTVLDQPAGTGNLCLLNSTGVSNGYNYADDTSCGLTATGDSQNVANDPLLSALADNGGPTQTLKPQAASPLIDVVPNGSCGAGLSITRDQRGAPRPASVGEGCDVGAVEVATTIRVRSSANSNAGAECTAAAAPAFTGCTLRGALTEASTGGWAAGKDVTIEIDPGLADIALTSGLNYDGGTGGAHALTINGHGNFVVGDDTFRLMISTSTGSFSVDSLTLEHGDTPDDGGALSVDGPLTVTGSVFDQNHANAGGGAVRAVGPTVVAGSTFSGNSAAGYGGAVGSLGNITVVGSTFSANTAGSGGGAIVTLGDVALTNSTFAGNATVGPGGAILSLGSTSAAYTTFTGNTATSAGSAVSATVTIELFADVLHGSATTDLCNRTATSDGYNYANDTSCGLAGTGDSQNVANDPALDALAWNGGPTETRKPQNGSPVIDRIPYGACQTASLATGIITDQRGLARPRNGYCDVGAVEVAPYDPLAPVTTTTTRPAGGVTTTTSSTTSTTSSTTTTTAPPGTTVPTTAPPGTTVPTTAPPTTTTTVVPAPAPTALTILPPDVSDRSAVVTWSAPVEPARPSARVGVSAVPTGYQLRCMPVGTPYDTGPNRYVRYVGSTTTSAKVEDMFGGRNYHCLVRARYGGDIASWKGDGTEGPLSDWSNTMYIPVTAPLSPRHVSATTPPLPSGQATQVAFTMPTNNSGAAIQRFTATCTSSNGGVTRTQAGSASPLTVSSLTVGKRYACAVTATNAQGTSVPSAPSPAIVVPAGPPTGVVASSPARVGGVWRTTVTFAAPSGGPTVSSYRVDCTPAGGGTVKTASGPASGVVVSDLVSGKTYRCSVVARFGSKPGPASAPSAPIVVP